MIAIASKPVSYHFQVLAELPSPVTGGTMLTVEDMQQEFVCNINIKHRFLLDSSFLFCENSFDPISSNPLFSARFKVISFLGDF